VFGIGIFHTDASTFGAINAAGNIFLAIFGLAKIFWFQAIGQKLCERYAEIKKNLQVGPCL
jgi:uncharacterized membrane protein YuzA (DUF378 family)